MHHPIDIYIFRDGSQTGPFNEETVQRLLEEKSVALDDLAWLPGAPEWKSLKEVLRPSAAEATVAAPPPLPEGNAAPPLPGAPETPEPANSAQAVGEPATGKQKAFLDYMGINVPNDLRKEQAALLMHEVMENPKDPPRLARWNEDRLRLYPELFAAEIQAKKDNRANHFFDLAQTVGAGCFEGLTKAHAQVLVGYLDVKFPHWDARQLEAAWNYFFPAIAEKFPTLVRKEWRGKLKYPTGPRVATELKERGSKGGAPRDSKSPMLALLAGLGIGAVAVAVVAVSLVLMKRITFSVPAKETVPAQKASAAAPAPSTLDARSAPTAAQGEPLAAADTLTVPTPVTMPAALPDGLPASVPPTSPEETMKPAASSEAPLPGLSGTAPADPAMAPAAAPAGTSPTPAPTSLDAVFNPSPVATAPAASPAAAPVAIPPAPAAPQRKANVVLTKAVEVPLPFGKALLPAGTQLKLVAQEGLIVKVSYLNMVVPIPVSSTDLIGETP